MKDPAAVHSAASQIRFMFTELVNGHDEINVPALTDQIVERLREDPDLSRLMIEQMVRPTVYEIGLSVLSQWRREKMLVNQDVVTVGDTAVTRDELQKRSQIRRLQWLFRPEHAGVHHIRLRAMTRQDLLTAAGEREGRAKTELIMAALLRHIASKLQDGERVSDRFSDAEIDVLYRNIGDSWGQQGQAAGS